MEDYDPYMKAFDNIRVEDNKKYNNFFLQENNFENNNNENNKINDVNEDIEMKIDNAQNEEKVQKNNLNEKEIIDKMQEETKFLNARTTPEENPDIINKNQNNELNTPNKNKDIDKYLIDISINNNLNKKDNEIKQKYDYGYSILLVKDGEYGLMEDFIKDKNNASTIRDCFNFGFDEKKWIKFLNHSIFVHYLKNVDEEKEKKRRLNSMINNNPMGNQVIMAPINPAAMINYYQNLSNFKNLQNNNPTK